MTSLFNAPRLVLAGLSGGAGKTILTLGLTRAFRRAGRRVRPFKKGPDYIDAAWLSLAAGHTACNLDPFIMPEETLPALFAERMVGFDLGLVEGNRGIFDGRDVTGSLSTAEIARRLDAPVVLVLDCTKMTRTAAAIIAGVNAFEPDLKLAGVVLNRTAGERHRSILRSAIEHYTDTPVLGALPKLRENPIPERHMGLMSDRELADSNAVDDALDGLAKVMEEHLDLPAVLALADTAAPLPDAAAAVPWPSQQPGAAQPTIGVVRDAAFWFYYPENLEALTRAGAKLVELSLLDDTPWPMIHGLYLGGGFPETHAERLADNVAARNRVRALSDAGLPIYAECGGLMYLADRLETGGRSYPMAGVFPISTRLCPRPQGLGYIEAEVVLENPFHPVGALLRGHEFHYSACVEPPDGMSYALRLACGSGVAGNRDGLLVRNTFASYAHTHALGVAHWAPRFADAARRMAGL